MYSEVNKGYKVIAHNLQGFDSYFMINDDQARELLIINTQRGLYQPANENCQAIQMQTAVKWSLSVKNEYNENVSWVMVDDDKGATLTEMYLYLSSHCKKGK